MANTVIVSETNYDVTVDESNNITVEVFTPSVGQPGYTGSTGAGYVGSRGDTGFTGSIGFTGSRGIDGIIGRDGYTGSVGFTGSMGYTGSAGYVGSQGVQGYDGSVGYTGSVGFTGSAGADGASGYTGSVGYVGSVGPTGYTGSKGDDGPEGLIGYTGSKGDDGASGQAGGIGYTGSMGIQGYTGSKGNEVLGADINRMGLMNQTETAIAFDDATMVFTLSSVGASWSYYRLGVKRTITGNKTVTLPPVDGTQYFITINGDDGELSYSTSPWNLTTGTNILVAMVYWDSTQTPKYFLQEERHTCLIDRRQHAHDHFLVGTQMRTTGATVGYTLNTDTNVAKTFGIGESVLIDEDIFQTLPELVDPNGTATDYIAAYRTASSTWKWVDSNMPFKYNTGTNVIQYDNNGTLADASDNRWVNSYVLFTNIAGKARHMIIPGRAQYTSLALAQAELPGNFTFTGFPTSEFVIGYQLTWHADIAGGGSYTSAGKCRLAADPKKLAIGAITTSATGGSIEHNTLAGLQGGDVGEYYHLSAAQVASLGGVISPAYAASMSQDITSASVIRITLTGNLTLGFSGGVDGQKFIVELTQDGAGGKTIAYDSSVRFGTDIIATTLTTSANKTDRVGFIYNSASGKYSVIAFAKGY